MNMSRSERISVAELVNFQFTFFTMQLSVEYRLSRHNEGNAPSFFFFFSSVQSQIFKLLIVYNILHTLTGSHNKISHHIFTKKLRLNCTVRKGLIILLITETEKVLVQCVRGLCKIHKLVKEVSFGLCKDFSQDSLDSLNAQ